MSAPERPLSVIGQRLPKVDAWAKVTGETRFADDLALPRMAYAKLLRAQHPHALIRRIDTTRAAALPGVYAVITGRDFPPVRFGIMPVSQDEEPLCVEKVRFVGDPVAAVAAVDEETAEAAARMIEVEYEPLDSLMSIEAALREGTHRIHEYGDGHNIHKLVSLEFGDVDEGFRDADLVREDVFFFEGNTHLPMEQHAAVAQWTPDGKLTLWSSTQTPHYVHRALGKVLEMPMSHIRVIATPNGGGFGGKSDPFSHEMAVARLAQITGRPVKTTLTREEVFYTHRGRHPVLMWVRSGVRKDGEILALHFRTLARRRRVRLLRRRVDLLHGRAPDGHLPDRAVQVRGVPGLHEQAALRPEARPRHAPAPVRARGAPRPHSGGAGARPRGDAAAHRRARAPEDGEPPDRDHLRPHRVHRPRRGGVGVAGEVPEAPAGPRDRDRGVRLPDRRRAADLLERHAALRRDGEDRPRRRRRGVLRVHRHRPGLGLDPRVHRRRGARDPARGRAGRHRRYRPHAGRPRLVLLARDAHDRQRGAGGGREAARPAPGRGGPEARRPARGAGGPRPADLPAGRSGHGARVRRGGAAGRGRARDAGRLRLVHAAPARREVQGIGGRADARVLLLGVRRGARGRPGDGRRPREPRVDRPRRRDRDQPAPRGGPGRGLDLHGARRGA